jgi:DNA-directed RNA polymerase subunit RPC12/RpoP
MIIKCFRCGKPIDTPDDTNADYVVASDMIADEVQERLFLLKDNAMTKAQKAKGEPVLDEEYDSEMIASSEGAERTPDFVKCVSRKVSLKIQKTGIVCPGCYKSDDLIIWGVHKAGK